MGEKGMESPAPSRSGVAVAGEAVGRAVGVGDMAGAIGGGSMAGDMQQAAGGSIGGAPSSETIMQASDTIRQPPRG
jgi:hypothetical protein